MDKYEQVITLWQSYKITSAADLDKYLDSFRILFAFHSGRIENEEITYHDTREIFENGKVSDYTGRNGMAFFDNINKPLALQGESKSFSYK